MSCLKAAYKKRGQQDYIWAIDAHDKAFKVFVHTKLQSKGLVLISPVDASVNLADLPVVARAGSFVKAGMKVNKVKIEAF